MRSGASLKLLKSQEIEDEGEIYESMEDIWSDYPSKEDFLLTKRNIEQKSFSFCKRKHK